MGLFDLFKKRPPPPEPDEPAEPALGWLAIEKAFDGLYPGQKPRFWTHNGVMQMHDLRNPPENPLDGVNIYDGGTFWHFVGLGLSDLYDKTSNDEWSGYGYELTFRLPKDDAPEPPLWPINVIHSIARATFMGSAFGPGHTIQMGPLDGPDSQTKTTAVLLTKEPGMERPISTPNGQVAFMLIVGIEDAVRQRALAGGLAEVMAELDATNPQRVTRT